MEVAGLMSFDTHSRWHEAMKKAYLSTPPPGYTKPNWIQLRNADRELFHRVAAGCSGGARATPGEDKTQFEIKWQLEMASAEVRHFLLPLPGKSRPSPNSSSASSSDNPVISRLERQLKQGQEQIHNLKRKFEGKGASDKGKGKGKQRRAAGNPARKPPIVEEMESRGYLTRSKGDSVCFKYNLTGCPDAAPGQKCAKGWHVCAHKKCKDKREPHAATTH